MLGAWEGGGWDDGRDGGGRTAGWEGGRVLVGCWVGGGGGRVRGCGRCGRCEAGGERKRGTLASATALDRTPGLFSSSPSSLASVLGPLGSLASSLQRSLGVWAFVILLVSWLLVLLLAPSGWLTAVVSVAMVPRQISTNRYREREYTTSRETEPVQPRRGPARSC